MAEWMHPQTGRKNHLFTRDERFPKHFNSACGQFVHGDMLDPPMSSDPQCAKCLRAEAKTIVCSY